MATKFGLEGSKNNSILGGAGLTRVDGKIGARRRGRRGGGGAVRFKGELKIIVLIFKFTPVGRSSAGVINDRGIVGGEDGMGRGGVPFQQNIGGGGGTGVAL